MKTLKDLIQERASKIEAQGELLTTRQKENRAFNEDEKKRFNQLDDEIKALDDEIAEARQLEDAQKRHAQHQAEKEGRKPDPKDQRSQDEKDLAKFNFMDAVRSAAQNKPLEGVAAEVYQEAQREAALVGTSIEGPVAIPGKFARQIFAPYQKRTNLAGTANVGAEMVEVEKQGVIGVLRDRMVLAQAGVRTIGGLVGNISAPTNGGVTVGWKGEVADADKTTPATDEITMSPNRLTGYMETSKQLLIQNPGWDTFHVNDFLDAIAVAIQTAAINGAGGTAPLGLLGTTGIGSVVGGTNGAAPDLADIINLEKEVAIDNADLGSLAYITNAQVRSKLKQTAKDAGSGLFVWGESNTLNGYNALATQSVPSDLDKGSNTGVCSAIIFGNWADLVIGNWGGFDITVDPYSAAKKGAIQIVANVYADVMVRRPQSFAAMLDALTT